MSSIIEEKQESICALLQRASDQFSSYAPTETAEFFQNIVNLAATLVINDAKRRDAGAVVTLDSDDHGDAAAYYAAKFRQAAGLPKHLDHAMSRPLSIGQALAGEKVRNA